MKSGMTRIFLALSVLFTLYSFVEAQQPKKLPRMGYISGSGNEADQGPYVEALRQGLRELGHLEGKTYTIEYRGAEGKLDRVPGLVDELIKINVDVLVIPYRQQSAERSRQLRRFPL